MAVTGDGENAVRSASRRHCAPRFLLPSLPFSCAARSHRIAVSMVVRVRDCGAVVAPSVRRAVGLTQNTQWSFHALHPSTPLAAAALANVRVGLMEQPVMGRAIMCAMKTAMPMAKGTRVWLLLLESHAA